MPTVLVTAWVPPAHHPSEIAVTSNRTVLVDGSVFTLDAVFPSSGVVSTLLDLVRVRAIAWATTDIIFIGTASARLLLKAIFWKLQRQHSDVLAERQALPQYFSEFGLAETEGNNLFLPIDDVAVLTRSQSNPQLKAVHGLFAFRAMLLPESENDLEIVSISVYSGNKLIRFAYHAEAATACSLCVGGAGNFVLVACLVPQPLSSDVPIENANTVILRSLLTARDIPIEPGDPFVRREQEKGKKSPKQKRDDDPLFGSHENDTEGDEDEPDLSALEDAIAAATAGRGRAGKEFQFLMQQLNALLSAKELSHELEEEMELLEREREALEQHAALLEGQLQKEKENREKDAADFKHKLSAGTTTADRNARTLQSAQQEIDKLQLEIEERKLAVAAQNSAHLSDIERLRQSHQEQLSGVQTERQKLVSAIPALEASISHLQQQLQDANSRIRGAELIHLAEFQQKELQWQRVLREAEEQKHSLMRENEHVRQITEQQLKTFRLVVQSLEEEKANSQHELQIMIDHMRALSPKNQPPRSGPGSRSTSLQPLISSTPKGGVVTPKKAFTAAKPNLLLSPAIEDGEPTPVSPLSENSFGVTAACGYGPTRNLDF